VFGVVEMGLGEGGGVLGGDGDEGGLVGEIEVL